MFKYYNANPLGRHVNDCVVRAISLAEEKTWDQVYEELSKYAQSQGITFSEIEFIDKYLSDKYESYCQDRKNPAVTVGDFANKQLEGRWLVTMKGHITAIINGIIYDTFDPSSRIMWCAYKVK